MSTIVLDPQSVDVLRTCAQRTVLKDADGNTVGYFEPASRPYAEFEIPAFDEDELDRREARHDVLPSSEVRRRLGIER